MENEQKIDVKPHKYNVGEVKPGDIVYGVCATDWDEIVCFDAMIIEDIGYKNVKVVGDWLEIDDDIFFDEKLAEERAIELAKEYGWKIVKGGLFTQEESNV